MSRCLVAAWIATGSLIAAAWATPASAADTERTRRVVLMQPSPALERALRTALMPWGMRVARPQSRARPPATPQNSEQARLLAQSLRADALVWISATSRRHELWLYDNTSGSLTARGVPAPPFDETRAAALALSVKTELRKGTLADSAPPAGETAAKSVASEKPAETSEVAPPADEPSASSDASALEASPPKSSEAPPPDIALDTPRRAVFEPEEPYDAPSLRFLLHGGARLAASSLDGVEGRYGVEGRWTPWASPTAMSTLWFGARFDLGLPRTIATENFRGEYSEVGAGLGAGVSVHATRWLELGGQLGASVYTASMSGTLPLERQLAQDTRKYGAALHLRPEVDLSLGAVGIVIQPALGLALARQLYQVRRTLEDETRTDEVMEMSPLWWQLGGAFRVDVD
jgi:hypothetical protein